jgi:hypothetical protein
VRGASWKLVWRGSKTPIAVISKRVGRPAMKRIARMLRKVHNPTLVHHGLARSARWHIVTADAKAPIADLYAGIEPGTANRIATELATLLGLPVMVLSNFGQPGTIAKHSILRERSGSLLHRPRSNPRVVPAVGEIWTSPGGQKCRVLSVSRNRVQYLELESGNRVWSDLAEFVATHRGPRRGLPGLNPKGRDDAALRDLVAHQLDSTLSLAAEAEAGRGPLGPVFLKARYELAEWLDGARKRFPHRADKIVAHAMTWKRLPNPSRSKAARAKRRFVRGKARGVPRRAYRARFSGAKYAQAMRSSGARMLARRYPTSRVDEPWRLTFDAWWSQRKSGPAALDLFDAARIWEDSVIQAIVSGKPVPQAVRKALATFRDPGRPRGPRVNPKGLKPIYGRPPLTSNAAHNRSMAARAFQGGMTAAEIARAWPRVWKLVDGKLAQIYDSYFVEDPERFETRVMITAESVRGELAARRSNPRGRDAMRRVISGGAARREQALSVFDRHRLRIARDTLKLSDVGARIMGGMTKDEARQVIFELTGVVVAKENPRGGPRIVYNKLLGGWYVVVGPHQTPLDGRFNSKAEAQAWLAGGGGRRSNPRGRVVRGPTIRVPQGSASHGAADAAGIERLRDQLGDAVATRYRREYPGSPIEPDPVTLKERRDFYALDIGSSGAFMVRKADGAIFGIKGYGTPDYRKGIAFLGDITGYELLLWRFARGPFRVDMKTITNRRSRRPGRRNPLPRSIARGSVRTLYRGRKRVLIGCPTGHYSTRSRRCRVGTRAFEVGGHRNPRRGPRKARARRNPSSEQARAHHQFMRWQDRRDARGRWKKVRVRKGMPRYLAGLGELAAVEYYSNKYDGKRKLYRHRTKTPRPLLATDPNGREVHIVGGHMKVTPDGLVN